MKVPGKSSWLSATVVEDWREMLEEQTSWLTVYLWFKPSVCTVRSESSVRYDLAADTRCVVEFFLVEVGVIPLKTEAEIVERSQYNVKASRSSSYVEERVSSQPTRKKDYDDFNLLAIGPVVLPLRGNMHRWARKCVPVFWETIAFTIQSRRLKRLRGRWQVECSQRRTIKEVLLTVYLLASTCESSSESLDFKTYGEAESRVF